jgi:hypothetical protein
MFALKIHLVVSTLDRASNTFLTNEKSWGQAETQTENKLLKRCKGLAFRFAVNALEYKNLRLSQNRRKKNCAHFLKANSKQNVDIS